MPQAAYGYWPLRRRGQRRDPVRRRTASARSTRFSFPRQNKEGGLCIADFFRDVDEQRARRDRPAGRDDGPPRLGGGARMVRRQPLPGLPLSARPLGRDGRGLRRIRPQAHPRRIGLCRRGGARPRRDAEPRLSRQPLLLRLPRLPQPRRPEAAPGRCCAPTRSASPSPRKTSSTPSNRPRPSSSTTPRPNIFRCDGRNPRRISLPAGKNLPKSQRGSRFCRARRR